MIGERVGHYRIRRWLGGGGMGEVYEAEDTRLGRPVALKFLPEKYFNDPRARERFQREARAASALNHPNICTVHDIGEHTGRPFIVMEYLQGKSLKRYLSTESTDLETKIDIAAQVAAGLQAAHSEGIVHRDIKPANIFVTESGLVKLVDFGLAKTVERPFEIQSAPTESMKESREGPLTAPGTLVGTIRYMSPEQALGRTVDARSDIFSLGVVLYEMITGRPPFNGDTAAFFFNELLHKRPQQPRGFNPDISAETEAVILRCLEKKPGNRYETAADFREKLIESFEGKRRLSSVWRWLLRCLIFIVAFITLAVILEQKAPDWRKNLPGFGPSYQDIAVLPFEIRGLDEQAEAAWQGLFKELTSALTRMQQFDEKLRVVPAREVDILNVKSPSQARRVFRVGLVIDGVVEWTGRDLRVTINLSDAAELRQLGSELVSDPESDLINVKERVLDGLVRLLEINLEPDTFRVLAATGTSVPGAYDHYARGLEYLERAYTSGNIERSISELELAVEEDRSFALAHATLSRALMRQFVETNDTQWLEKAERECEESSRLDSRLPETHIACSAVDAAEGRYEEAVAGYREAIELDPNNSEARRRLAFALARMGKLEEAESVWTSAIGLRPDYWVGYYELGTFWIREGDFEKAIEPLRRALGYLPENYQISGNLGAAFHQLGRLDEAAEYYLLSAQIEPNYAALANLGSIHFHQGNFVEAAENYQAALDLNDSDYAVWGNLALACNNIPERSAEAAGLYEKAIALAESRQEVNPNNIEVTIHLADYYLEAGRNEEGRQMLETALKLHSENPDLMARLGVLHEKLGDREQAILWVVRALKAGYPKERLEALSSMVDLRNDPEFQRQFEELEPPGDPVNINH